MKLIPDQVQHYSRDGSIDKWFALGSYAGPLGSSIRRAKYRPDFSVMNGVARRIAFTVDPIDIDVVVPIAPDPLRLLRRGFNPAFVLANRLATHLKKPTINLFKRIDPRSQVSRSKHQRHRACNRFKLKKPIPSHRILLVDDVRTSGATLRECGELLKRAGAKKVIGIVVASTASTKNK